MDRAAEMIDLETLTTTFCPLEDLMTAAENNPKHAAGLKKAPMHCIPPIAIIREGQVMQHGADKYAPFNWGDAGVVASIYYDAILRHLFAWYAGQDDDPDSGVTHLAHIRACAGILIDCAEMGLMEDDRPAGKTMLFGSAPRAPTSEAITAADIAAFSTPRRALDPVEEYYTFMEKHPPGNRRTQEEQDEFWQICQRLPNGGFPPYPRPE